MIAEILLAAAAAAAEVSPQDRFPEIAAAYLVAIDGEIVWAREAETARPPASLTKIMTALILLEGDWRPETPVAISPVAVAATGSSAGLRPGEAVPAGDLMALMLVASANDACLALAEHASGTVEAFVEAMNARAASLGLVSTHFANPCGHDAPDHQSSPRDLMALTEAALRRPEFARVVALPSFTARTTRGRRITLASGNHLLGRSPGVEGVKTGTTRRAGKCLVVLARRDGVRVLIVLLDLAERWWTAAALVEESFDAARAHR